MEIAPDAVHWHSAAPDSWFRIWRCRMQSADQREHMAQEPVTTRGMQQRRLPPAPASAAQHCHNWCFPGGIPELEDLDFELFEIFSNCARRSRITGSSTPDASPRNASPGARYCLGRAPIGRCSRRCVAGRRYAGPRSEKVTIRLFAVGYGPRVADFIGLTTVLAAHGVLEERTVGN